MIILLRAAIQGSITTLKKRAYLLVVTPLAGVGVVPIVHVEKKEGDGGLTGRQDEG